MELVPLGPGFGVEVKGISMLDVASDDQAYKAVRAAFEEHSLLLFRDQPIADDIQVAYSRAFGPLELTKVASAGAGGFYSSSPISARRARSCRSPIARCWSRRPMRSGTPTPHSRRHPRLPPC